MYDFATKGHIYEQSTSGLLVLVIESSKWLHKKCIVLDPGESTAHVGSIREFGVREPYWKKLT
jgi:hypothetical protein